MSGEKSGYSRWDLKFLLREVGFSNAEQKKTKFVGQMAARLPAVPMKDLPGGRKMKKKSYELQRQTRLSVSRESRESLESQSRVRDFLSLSLGLV